jgi:acetyl xylan esterase AXE1
MTVTLLLLVGLLIAAHVGGYVTLVSRKSTRVRVLAALVALEAFVLLHLVVGAYAQKRWDAIDSISQRIRGTPARPSFPATLSGDPALLTASTAGVPVAPPEVSSLEALERWQVALRQRLRDSLLKIPGGITAQAPRWEEFGVQTVADGVQRHAMTLRSFDGTTLPAYLFVPARQSRMAGVVVLPGHPEEDEESGLAQTAGLVDSYQHGAALELARTGLVTLTFELRGFGLLGPPAFPHHLAVTHNALLGGSSYKAVLFRDVEAAIALLVSRPEVDGGRIGVTGTSIGGEMTAFYAALDTRVAAAVVNSFAPTSGPYLPEVGRPGEENDRHVCHLVPGENQLLSQPDWFYLIAPRPLMVVTGESERFGDLRFLFKPYQDLGLADAHRVLEVRGRGHEFFVEQTAEFFQRHLRASAER